MKILYYSDKYAYNVMGSKRSIFEEIKDRGIQIVWKDGSLLGKVLTHIEQIRPTQIWLVSSNLILSQELKDKIEVPVIAFGFSDPCMFDQARLYTCDVYVTNNYSVFQLLQTKNLQVVYNPVGCDFRFHKKLDLPKTFDITVTGCAIHSKFKNPKGRIEVVNRLRDDGFDVWAFGNNWPAHPKNKSHIEGQAFLNVINSSKIGLDIQEDSLPLSHRMFEYSACGVSVVTKHRCEVFAFFKEDYEIKTYTNYESLKKVLFDLLTEEQYKFIGENALKRCEKEHSILSRVDHLLYQLKELL